MYGGMRVARAVLLREHGANACSMNVQTYSLIIHKEGRKPCIMRGGATSRQLAISNSLPMLESGKRARLAATAARRHRLAPATRLLCFEC